LLFSVAGRGNEIARSAENGGRTKRKTKWKTGTDEAEDEVEDKAGAAADRWEGSDGRGTTFNLKINQLWDL